MDRKHAKKQHQGSWPSFRCPRFFPRPDEVALPTKPVARPERMFGGEGVLVRSNLGGAKSWIFSCFLRFSRFFTLLFFENQSL